MGEEGVVFGRLFIRASGPLVEEYEETEELACEREISGDDPFV